MIAASHTLGLYTGALDTPMLDLTQETSIANPTRTADVGAPGSHFVITVSGAFDP